MIRRIFLFCLVSLAFGLVDAPSFAADTFHDCPQCPEMIVIKPGSFNMGSPKPDEEVHGNEGPRHRVTIAHAFAVGIYDVTFEQWDACVTGGGCIHPISQDWGRGSRPAISVSWDDTQDYIRWLNERVRSFQPSDEPASGPGPYRLLTEAEWEYAARAGTTTVYYWGNSYVKGSANCDGCGSEWDNEKTAPVGSFAPNPWGLYDMAGNVLQWVDDCYHDTYAKAPTDGSSWKGGKCDFHVMRGGSWYNSTYYLRASQRYSAPAYFRALNLGLRVAKTLE